MTDVLAGHRVVPVVVLNDAADAAPLGAALIAGGLPVAEVTFRTAAAEQALKELAANPALHVGAGTVITVEQVERAVAAGARFIVSPGVSIPVLRRCRDLGVPVLPGTANATDIMTALDEGLDLVKFFPAGPLGGVSMLKALIAPFPAVRFVPTGGIDAASAPSYLALPAVAAIGGSWMVAADLIKQRRFDRVAELSAQAVAIASTSGGSDGAA